MGTAYLPVVSGGVVYVRPGLLDGTQAAITADTFMPVLDPSIPVTFCRIAIDDSKKAVADHAVTLTRTRLAGVRSEPRWLRF